MDNQRIVVTGLGVVILIGIGQAAFWESVTKGKSGISTLSRFDTSAHNTHMAGEIQEF